MRYRRIIGLAVLLAFSTVQGESRIVDRHPEVADALELLDLWIEEQMAYEQIPGLAIGIVYDQELIWARGYGQADLERQTPITPRTLFRIASMTKLFTATAIMHLRDAGKLRLEEPVTTYLPWFEIRNPFTDAPPITIWHLLTHTAGLPRDAAFPYWTTHAFPAWEAVKKALPDQTLIYPTGSTYKYSNLGMALLGEIVAAVSGQPYAQYVQQHILDPLGMASTAVIPTQAHHQQLATGYTRRHPNGSRQVMTYYDTNGMLPMGNIVSSVEDLARFATAQFGGQGSILKPGTLKEMHRVHWLYGSWTGGRGLGFAVSRHEGRSFVYHGGWLGGFRSRLMFRPEEKIALIVLTNAEDVSPTGIAYEAYDLLAPVILQAVSSPVKPAKAERVWRKYLGVYTDPWGWETRVLIHNNRLALYGHNYPPEEEPEASLTLLTPVGKDTFRLPDGELLVFELDKSGQVLRLRKRYEYLQPKEQ